MDVKEWSATYRDEVRMRLEAEIVPPDARNSDTCPRRLIGTWGQISDDHLLVNEMTQRNTNQGDYLWPNEVNIFEFATGPDLSRVR
jgi:hypothetical protein